MNVQQQEEILDKLMYGKHGDGFQWTLYPGNEIYIKGYMDFEELLYLAECVRKVMNKPKKEAL